MRILLVEDEPLIAMDLEIILASLGHEVVGIAETQADASALAMQTRPDMALVDLRLRDGFTGLSIAAHFSGDLKLACALVTGNPEQVRDAPYRVVRKPYTPDDIASVLPKAA